MLLICCGAMRRPTYLPLHPAYSETDRELLRFSSTDGPTKDGLDYEFALICCGIVTGNTWASGWIAVLQDEQYSRVNRPANGVLRGSTYYYFVGDHAPTHKYPIVPSFHHWRFPHDALPNIWARLEIPAQDTQQDEAVLARDVTCRVSAHKGARELAHLVPVTEGNWFTNNGMRRYCRNPVGGMAINDTMNILVLRKDLHFLFDHRRFVFAAKRDRSDAVHLVVHVLSHEKAEEIIDLYHNRRTQALHGVSAEMVFARLAWALFTSADFPAFDGAAKMAVRLFNAETSQTQAQALDQHDICGRLRSFKPYSRSRSKSGSPTERALDEINEADGFCDYLSESADDLWGDELDDCYSRGLNSVTPPRGRSRKRKRGRDMNMQDSPPGLLFVQPRHLRPLRRRIRHIQKPFRVIVKARFRLLTQRRWDKVMRLLS
ncbi:hypothetical protein A9K55_005104 [Cordyceps militaris]|uniref:HNH nuclease domain-containing protein n=1 Tax=Cordyceps militaris TaxID=73501 RepID=A0A2H4SNT2_CORMI|nr:hypothetical protein A9K55_005104 [Cordyceps militaris]